jgi:hypothetical protein
MGTPAHTLGKQDGAFGDTCDYLRTTQNYCTLQLLEDAAGLNP